ncbi:hypothetical protein [Sporosarcina sp. FSL K6-1508]|uniref:hypothetical protein n=1 Tax=Sporosarcina sp. FSL K6-1508 TaxID=2921553 RepID=UPI0030F4C4D2
MYPIYIRHNKYWFAIHNPYQPYITPFPEKYALKIKINEPIKIKFPNRFFKFYRRQFELNLVKRLLEWLEEEYILFQEEWKLRTTPLYLT